MFCVASLLIKSRFFGENFDIRIIVFLILSYIETYDFNFKLRA